MPSVFGPLQAAVAKAQAGSSIVLFFVGDSTVWGACDGGDTTVSAGGWPKRLGIAVGQYCGVTVKYRVYSPFTQTYSTDSTVYTGTGSNQVLVVNGGVSSQFIASLTKYINSYNLITSTAATADCVFIGTGINDAHFGATPSTYVPDYLGFIDLIRSFCTTAQVVVTTQDVLSAASMAASYSRYEDNYNALLTELVGGVLPINPALRHSTAHAVWALDTQQAYGGYYQSSLMADGVHPNASGYTAQANFMATNLLASPPAPVITTLALNPVVRAVSFTQAIAANGTVDSWSVVSTAPNILPDGLFLNTSTGVISGIPTAYGGTYTFTLRATNGSGYDDQVYTGPIDRNLPPYTPDGSTRPKQRLMGLYYPVTPRIQAGGAVGHRP